jgi:hypothetical protein
MPRADGETARVDAKRSGAANGMRATPEGTGSAGLPCLYKSVLPSKLRGVAATNAFGTYLETKDLLRHSAERSESVVDETGSGRVEVSNQALSLLMNGHFPKPVPELLEDSGVPVAEFSEALGILQRAGLVAVDQTDGRQIAALTEQGQALRPG